MEWEDLELELSEGEDLPPLDPTIHDLLEKDTLSWIFVGGTVMIYFHLSLKYVIRSPRTSLIS